MKIEFQKNGVKIIGATPCAINDAVSGCGLLISQGKKDRFLREFIVSCFLYNVGIQVITMQFPENLKNTSCRGRINTFSRKSSHRFRDLLLSVYVPDKQYLAITVTLPNMLAFDLVQAVKLSWLTNLPLTVFLFQYVTPFQWEKLIKRFRMNLIRSRLAGVWRVELQKRNVPHLHIIGFGNNINDVSNYAKCWFEAVDGLKDFRGCSLSSYDGFLIYGFVCKFVRSENWVKYVASHASKHKESQLGWSGRQWGIFNNSLISRSVGSRYDLSEETEIYVMRTLRRMTKYKGFNKNLFGSLQLFVSPAIIKRLLDFYSLPLPF